MERLKKSLKNAMKNIWFNRKQYVFFAVFLILVQSLISGIILFGYNGNRNEIRYLEEQCVVQTEDQTAAYTYHMSLGNMSPEALASLINTYNGTQASQREWDLVSAKRVGDTGKGYAYIRFLETNGQSAYSRYRNFCVSEHCKRSQCDGRDYAAAYRHTKRSQPKQRYGVDLSCHYSGRHDHVRSFV